MQTVEQLRRAAPGSVTELRNAARTPEFQSSTLHIIKSVVAATLAWWLAVAILKSEIPFLAPWVAIMIMMPTVVKSLKHGAQTTIASWIGVGLSYLIGTLLGVHLWSLALALFLGMLVTRIPGLRLEGFNAATTVIFVLGAGYADQAPLLDNRAIEVAIGAAVGILVNMLVMPPKYDREAARDVLDLNARVGVLLKTLAEKFKNRWDEKATSEWLEQIEDLSSYLAAASSQVEQAQQSRKANIRTRMPRLRPDNRSTYTTELDSLDYAVALQRTDEAVSHLRHMTRSLQDASLGDDDWDNEFRERWSYLVMYVGEAISDPDVSIDDIRERFHELTQRFPEIAKGEPSAHWPVYGSLIASIGHIANIVKDVEPVQEEVEKHGDAQGMQAEAAERERVAVEGDASSGSRRGGGTNHD